MSGRRLSTDLGPIAKSIAPAIASLVLGVVGVLASWIVLGHLDVMALRLAVAALLWGVAHGVVVYFVPNTQNYYGPSAGKETSTWER